MTRISCRDVRTDRHCVVVVLCFASAIPLGCGRIGFDPLMLQDGGADGDTDTDADADTDTDADGDTDIDADADTDIDTDADTDIDADADTDIDTDADTDIDADADTDADTDSDTDTTGECTGTMTFGQTHTFPVVDSPKDMALGDYNADGITDLAVVNSNTDNVVILLGDGAAGEGDGTFTPHAEQPLVGDLPQAIVTGDFDGDGILDLAVTNNLDDTVTVLKGDGSAGDGDGTFTLHQTPAVGDGPIGIAVDYFDGDTNLDLVVVDSGINSFSLSILLGNGDGTFAKHPEEPPTGERAHGITVADFNEDGFKDLSVADSGSFPEQFTILLGDGDGTFTAAPILTDVNGPRASAVGDFDDDDILDLAITNHSENTIGVFHGNGTSGEGDGTFTFDQTYIVGDSPDGIVAKDLDRDGVLDLVVAVAADREIGVLFGQGDGTFQAGTNYTAGASLTEVVTRDFDADGYTDIAAVSSFDDHISIHLGVCID